MLIYAAVQFSPCPIAHSIAAHVLPIPIYETQNKIPHRRICNISATNGLIFKILEAAYSWHFSESNGIQCIHCTLIIQLLWKLQFFTGDFFGNNWIIMKNGHQTHQTLILLITMSGELCLNATRHFNASQIPSTSWRKSCKQYGMICHRTPSTKPYWALYKDFELVWKLGADTLDTSWNKLFLHRVLNC